ncbi:MAG: S8 family serine peptidase [Candidatus Thorarchaeota archaeon]
MEHVSEPHFRRGTALLVISVIFVAAFSIIVIIVPYSSDQPDLSVRVCVIDSGINKDNTLRSRVILESSFINTSYGYSINLNSTADSLPLYTPHGTYVAKIIARDAPDAAIVNAKVVTSNNTATVESIVAAIHWAVEEAECDIINLSIGTYPYVQGMLREAVRWAFYSGVTIVAAAGNDGQGGIAGTSVDSPAVYPEVIAVGAVNEGGMPYDFSARGPLRNRTVKPDIAANGFYSINGAAGVFGTSFAAPVVASAAANIINFCEENEWSWTPGMIKAVLTSTATYLSSEAWEVGAGLLNSERAIELVNNVAKRSRLPMVAYLTPATGPFVFERWFVNSSTIITGSVFCSRNTLFTIIYSGSAAEWVHGPTAIRINQTGSFQFSIDIISNETLEGLTLTVTLSSSAYSNLRARMTFDAALPLARIAFDISHTPWLMDSIYGQFREMYSLLTSSGIAVEEIRFESDITPGNLGRYDAIFILDPCAWGYRYEQGNVWSMQSFTYSQSEKDAYLGYWESGGSILVVGMGNRSLDMESANSFLSLFGFQLNYDRIPRITIEVGGISSTLLITDLMNHTTTENIESFDFVGCSVNYTGNAYSLAQAELSFLDEYGVIHIENYTVMAALEGVLDGRMIVSGTNFMFDNWGVEGYYQSEDNDRFLLQIAYWLIGVT